MLIHTLVAQPSAHDAFSDYAYKMELIKDLVLQFGAKISKANCLNQLRAQNVDFINLGNIVYCPAQKLMLIFKAYQLYAYDLIEEFTKNSITLR